jgi:hypothetical protein
MTPPPRGPWIATATLCERVLQESDGVLSLIRLIDRITHSAMGTNPPVEMPPFEVDFWAVISFRSDEARGRHSVAFRPEKPSGEQLAATEQPVLFEGEERGAVLVFNLKMTVDQEGLYWFDILLDDQQAPLTRIPLRVIYQPQKIATA